MHFPKQCVPTTQKAHLSGFSPKEEIVLHRKQCFLRILEKMLVWVFLRRWVTATRKDWEFSHIIRAVLVGFLGHRLLPHESIVLNWKVCITEYSFYPRNSTSADFPWADAHVEFQFWVPICSIFRIRKLIFLQCLLFRKNIYHILNSAQLGGRWDGQTVDTWLSYIHIYEIMCMYVYTCVYTYTYTFLSEVEVVFKMTCSCIQTHTSFSRQL